jgi:hypothetical protein
MPGGLGNTYSIAVLDYLLGSTALSLPGTWYAALFSVSPSDTGGGTELSGSGYVRIALLNNTTNFPASSVLGGVATKLTGSVLTWGPASGSTWATAVAVGFYDASTSGNLGWWGPLASPVTVSVGQSLQIAIGSGVFTQG